MRLFLTGKPGVGKTTIIKEIVEAFPSQCDGFYTEEVRTGKGRSGFQIKIIPCGQAFQLATSIDKMVKGPKVGKYTVNMNDLETGVLSSFPTLPNDIRIIDEIGKMELMSRKVTKELDFQVKSSAKIIIGTVPLTFNHWLVNDLK